MDVLDRLERLAKLRATGALSEAEFAAAKAQLLAGQAPSGRAAPVAVAPEAPGRPVWPWLVGAAVLVLLVLGIGLLIGRDVGGAAAGNFTEARVENDSVANEAAVSEPVPTPTPSAPVADYAAATDRALIGISAEDLERRLGPAASKAGGRWSYEIGGCAVTYAVRHDTVAAVTLPIGPGCHPIVNGVAVTERTTLGAFDGEYRADCVAQCGATPQNLTLVTRGAVFAAADAPLDGWAAAIGGDAGDGADSDGGGDDPGRFRCVADPPLEVAAQLGEARVSSVTIGHDGGGCRRARQ